jgi:diguanylate cyclase (GGDEF)-like protein
VNGLTAGLVLPQSVLTSDWFMWLATVVAFNTIVYVGLTLAKLIPLPKQFHPSRVRGWLRAIGTDVDKDTAVDEIPTRAIPEGTNPYDRMRTTIAKRDIPQAFALVGGFVVLLAAAAIIGSAGRELTDHLVELAAGMIFLLLAQILGRRDFGARTMMWTWATASTLLVLIFIVEAFHARSQTPLAYALIAMTAFAPVTLAWRPTFTASGVMFAGMTVASVMVPGVEDLRIVASTFAALVIGATLLRLRLTALDALSDEQAKSEALATTDVLTGALTRNGLVSLMPEMAGIAERVEEHVCVMLVDINSLEKANEQYGVRYGDDVLREVANVVEGHVRAGDLVARWGGDEFLVAGLGHKPDAQLLATRIEEAVRRTGINLGRWPTTVKVGTAAGDPRETTFDTLVAEAIAEAGHSSTQVPTSGPDRLVDSAE